MKSFFEFFIKRHLLASLMTVMILLLGLFSLYRINLSELPKIDIGEVVISTYYPGASPEDVELNVTNKLENELQGIVGIKQIISASLENNSIIDIEIDIDAADEEKVKTEIREAVARVSDFPPEVTEIPRITEVKTSLFPIIEVGMTSEVLPYPELREYARQFEKKLKEIPGIATINRYGYRSREVKVEVLPDNMMKYKIPMREIINAIEARNIRASGGSLESYTSEKNVVTLAQFRNPMDVGDVIVRSSSTGSFVRVKDLAIIRDDFEDERVIPRMNGRKTIAFLATKNENADVVKTVDAVKALVEKEQGHLPETIEFLYTNDASINVRNKFEIVQKNGLIGLAFVLLVLWLFFNIRTSFWVAMGIPVSLLGVILFLPLFDVDLDSITLTAMVLVLGIIVDDAIVITENIFRRREMGDSPLEATINGVHEVYKPVLTTITTTFLAFLPMFLIGGVMGRFVFVIPLTITLALSMSLLESFTMLPAHIMPGLRSSKKRPCCRTWFSPIKEGFKRLSSKLLTLRYLWVVLAVMVLLGSLVYARTSLRFLFSGTQGANSFTVNIELPKGTSLQATADKMREIEALIESLPKDEVEAYTMLIGASSGLVNRESEHVATLSVNLTPYGTRDRTADDIVEDVRAQVAQIEGVENVVFSVRVGGPPTGKPVTVRVVGANDTLRKQLADDIVTFLGTLDGVRDIDRDDKLGKDEVALQLDYERLARYGLTVADIARNVRIAYDGQVVTSTRYGEEDVEFRVMVEKMYRQKLDYLKQLRIPNLNGELIALDEVAKLSIGPGPAVFYHYDGERAITVDASVLRYKTTPLEVTNAIMNRFNLDQDYPGMILKFGGEAQETQSSLIELALTFIIAALGIYFLLVLLFDSLLQPLLVILSIPFGISGVIFAFGLHGRSLTFLAAIGVIGMAGVVVNDSLVLVDHLNQLTRRGSAQNMKALVASGTSDRLRPVLLTTLTTVAGLLPLAYGIGGEDTSMGPMAFALGYGLLFATPITLVLLPSLYMIGYDLKGLFGKAKEGLSRAVKKPE
jgi:multidrug efflux pump subunit AcrB